MCRPAKEYRNHKGHRYKENTYPLTGSTHRSSQENIGDRSDIEQFVVRALGEEYLQPWKNNTTQPHSFSLFSPRDKYLTWGKGKGKKTLFPIGTGKNPMHLGKVNRKTFSISGECEACILTTTAEGMAKPLK